MLGENEVTDALGTKAAVPVVRVAIWALYKTQTTNLGLWNEVVGNQHNKSRLENKSSSMLVPSRLKRLVRVRIVDLPNHMTKKFALQGVC
jgi:rhamnogalacturonyl hydrolase YesR